ncbi:hypothetical protein GobsT_64220 [Gemmata obscuriglobus]|nr:hypothetical protein [Gemmata obscuriglobus]QEG31600.1 hypothetical protein GobsT_64220 [Gemmata obscuriglobus]VTS10942.1 unnamed protein product [Gemmata obscuriglobus UQM 2246]
MSCPTCAHTMQTVVEAVFWCPRCGSLRLGPVGAAGTVDLGAPALVTRCRSLVARVCEDVGRFSGAAQLVDTLHRCGVIESINAPEERPQ